jgi:hypothetical protein
MGIGDEIGGEIGYYLSERYKLILYRTSLILLISMITCTLNMKNRGITNFRTKCDRK